MRRLYRPDLDEIDSTALPVLKERQKILNDALAQYPKDSKEWNNTIKTHWDNGRAAHPLNTPEYESDGSLKKGWKPRSVIAAFEKMNRGSSYCMYCEYSHAESIDHFWPKTPYPERAFEWDNMFWSCGPCNQSKETHFELDASMKPRLLNPAEEEPRAHITLILKSGQFDEENTTARGRYTIVTLKLNLRGLPKKRQDALQSFRIRLNSYCSYRRESDLSMAEANLATLKRDPFQFIFEELIHLYREEPNFLPPWCKEAFDRYSELHTWLVLPPPPQPPPLSP